MTRIVNLYKETCEVYIGRGGRNNEGYFGNPHPIGFCEICNCEHDRESSLSAFKVYFNQRIKTDEQFKIRFLGLKDKILGCFCKPKACHGDIYVEYLDSL